MVNLTRLGEGVWDLLPDPDPTGSREQKGEPVVTSTLPDPEAPKPTSSSFQAKWDKYLQPSEITTRQKVGHIFSSFFLLATPLITLVWLLIEKLVHGCILHAAFRKSDSSVAGFYFDDCSTELKKHFNFQSHTVITPDGCELKVMYFQYKNPNPETPTLLFFNQNAAFAEEVAGRWFYDLNIVPEIGINAFNCHCVFFNYRQVDNSKGKFRTAKDLVVDGYSVVQWLREKMRVPPHLIHFFGSSLGGAVAAQVQALDPALTGKHVNVRSFSSLKDVLKAHMGCLGPLAHALVRRQNCDMDALSSFDKLTGDKLVIYHPQDEIIPRTAQLRDHTHSMQLESGRVIILASLGGLEHWTNPDSDNYRSGEAIESAHNHPLRTFRSHYGSGKNILENITYFLFSRRIRHLSLSQIDRITE